MDLNGIFSVEQRVVLITGGGKGIGSMIAEGFVLSGANVYITGREEKALAAKTSELNALVASRSGRGKCSYIVADLQSVSGVEKIVADLSARESKLHVLVNNAGANWGADLEDYPDEAFTKVITLNLQRVFTLTQKCIPLMMASLPEGKDHEGPWAHPANIINIGSVDGIRVPSLQTYAYSASKAGLHQLSRVLAAELGRRGFTVNTLACGPFETKMMAATLAAGRDFIISKVPLARIGEPEDVAMTCVFLASKAGAFINGAIIPLDGGSLTAGGQGNANL